MTLKILQLNIFQGKFLNRIIEYVKEEDFDILHFQEVTGGKMSRGGMYNYSADLKLPQVTGNEQVRNIDCVKIISERLNYNSDFIMTHNLQGDTSSYYGNATFFKKSLKRIDCKKILLNEYKEIDLDFNEWDKIGRGALCTQFEKEGKKFWTINTHLAWGPTPLDTDVKINQSKVLIHYINALSGSIVLTGDFNVTPQTKTARQLTSFGVSQTEKNNIKNTLNSRIHPARHLFPPGLAVDYIITSPEIKVHNFKVQKDIDLSDHLGLSLEFEHKI